MVESRTSRLKDFLREMGEEVHPDFEGSPDLKRSAVNYLDYISKLVVASVDIARGEPNLLSMTIGGSRLKDDAAQEMPALVEFSRNVHKQYSDISAAVMLDDPSKLPRDFTINQFRGLLKGMSAVLDENKLEAPEKAAFDVIKQIAEKYKEPEQKRGK